ncbi:MerC domain-containing protein [Sphingomicrobium sediminis]|uniref:MerC domain-containing protein n=1 Tax=Sphingomicrobium sediminis TaxID=2950949 RepID=A0A9X2J211_9SPHN|nr:MerC domain-containing protein [Sphingomicrobium sediminis]MCM8556555.1 MerC domain-containing protein [Sphingomicrobium sediminis]
MNATTLTAALATRRADRIAIGLSGLCLVHCIATVAFVATVASAGGLLGSEIVHEVGLGLAMIIGAYALGRGIFEHRYMMPSAVGGLGLGVMGGALTMPHDGNELLATMVGVAILALGHRLNEIASD